MDVEKNLCVDVWPSAVVMSLAFQTDGKFRWVGEQCCRCWVSVEIHRNSPFEQFVPVSPMAARELPHVAVEVKIHH